MFFTAIIVVAGGLRSVAYADVLNMVIIVVGIGGIIGGILGAFGWNMSNLFAAAVKARPLVATTTLAPIGAVPVVYLLLGCYQMFHWCGWPHLQQRWFASRSAKGVWYGGFTIWITNVFVVLYGVCMTWAAATIWPNYTGPADRLSFMYAIQYLNPVVTGALLCGMIAAAYSTAAALVLMCGSIVTNDILKVAWPKMSERRLTVVARTVCIILIVFSAIVSLYPLGLLQIIATAMTYPGYGVLAVVATGAVYWKRANKYGAIAALIVGIIVAGWGALGTPRYYGLPFGMLIVPAVAMTVAAIAFVVVCLATPPSSKEALKRFGFKVD